MEKSELKNKLLPMLLAVLVIIADQITKAIVCVVLPLCGTNATVNEQLKAKYEYVNVSYNIGEEYSWHTYSPEAFEKYTKKCEKKGTSPVYLQLENGSYKVNDGPHFLEIIHARNTGVAFSFGAHWPEPLRRVAFSIVPVIILVLVIVVYFRNKEYTQLQRWAIGGIVGGGFGNIIDRLFRSKGVVDFIDVKWFGLENSRLTLFSMNRWPTFNVADSAVVVCGILLIIGFIIQIVNESKNKDKKQA